MENELIELLGALPSGAESSETESIRVYKPRRSTRNKKLVSNLIRFGALVAFFSTLYFVTYFLFFKQKDLPEYKEASAGEVSDFSDITEHATEITDIEKVKNIIIPTLIDEANTGINIEDYCIAALNGPFSNAGEGIKVLIIHSHTGEKVSENIGVVDAGEAIVSLLNTSGIGALHCRESHDECGRIGAYNRMKGSIEEIASDHTELLLIIDLHAADASSLLSFDIGVSADYSWKENLRAAASIYYNMDGFESVVRLLPRDLGQDTGIVTVSVAIGNPDADDESARRLISALGLSIIELFTENTPEFPG